MRRSLKTIIPLRSRGREVQQSELLSQALCPDETHQSWVVGEAGPVERGDGDCRDGREPQEARPPAILSAHGGGVAADHPVVIAESFEWVTEVLSHDERELSLLKELSIESRQLPLMQLSSLIELLRYDYDVTFRRGSSLSQLGLDELVGTRQVAILDGPTAIHLWFDRNSKMIHRVELDWE